MFTLTLSNYFGSLGNPGENWFVVIDSCQNKVSADQYHLTVLWAQVSTHPGRVLFEVIRWQVTSIQMIAGSSFFLIHMKYVVLMSPWPRAISILISNWPQIENSTSYSKVKSGKTDAFHFPHHIHALVTLYVQFWSSDWSKFDRWVHAESLYSILKLFYFDSWSWQSFFANLWCFWLPFSTGYTKWNTVAIKIESLLLFMAGLFIEFLVEKCAACQSRKSDFGWHRFRSPCWMRVEKVSSDSGLTW